MAADDRPDDLLLKVTPTRVPPNLLQRPRLRATDAQLADRPLVVVQAPAGFGKTSLLAQWRREHLAQGTAVAWVTAQERDDPARIVRALALAVRQAAARPTFGHTLLDRPLPAGLEGITTWLAELAQAAMDTVLILDEVDRWSDAAREALRYLLHNAPANLRVLLGTRSGVPLGVDDLVDYGLCLVLGPMQLRFQLDETLALVRQRLGDRLDRDAAARLHELTEGWPLGLQGALAALAASPEPLALLAALAAHGAPQRDRFVQLLLAKLDAPDLEFLQHIAIADPVHPALCEALAGVDGTRERLARLVRDTPIFAAAEGSEWLRLHGLAREALLERAATLGDGTLAELHQRASRWLAEAGLLDAAARHARAGGQHERAWDLAERSVYDALMARGRLDAVLPWLDGLPADELPRRPRLLLAAAWALALGERRDEATRLIERLRRQPRADPTLRCECALIESGAALFADDPDRFAALHDPWAEPPPGLDAAPLQVHANRSAFRALLEGQPAQARLRQQQSPPAPGLAYLGRWSEWIHGLSYLWEGQVLLAVRLLQPALAGAENELGRRHPFACMLAAVLAAAQWENNQPAEAAALLAHRLDVLERGGLPETVLLGWRTMARIAAAEGGDHRALALLGALAAVGEARHMPRLVLASLSDQVRLHARAGRAQTCQTLCEEIDALWADPATPSGPLWRRLSAPLVATAHALTAFAAQQWRPAVQRLAEAEQAVQRMQLGRQQIELAALRAYALDRCGERTGPLLAELVDLARTHGLARVFDDAHPAVGQWVRECVPEAGPATSVPPPAPRALRAAPATALTPKEREVLELAARNLSNKEIGRAMQVGEETVKWHLKNLFNKLDAGTRKQLVQRATLLGLLQES